MNKLNKETFEKLEYIDKMNISNNVKPDFESIIYSSNLKDKYPFHVDYNNFIKHYKLDFFIELLKEDLTSLTPVQKEEFYYHIKNNTNAKFTFHSKVDFRKRFKRTRFWIAYELAIWLHNHFEDDIVKVYSNKENKKIESVYNKIIKIKTLNMTPTKATNIKYNILSFVSLVYKQDFLYEKTIVI